MSLKIDCDRRLGAEVHKSGSISTYRGFPSVAHTAGYGADLGPGQNSESVTFATKETSQHKRAKQPEIRAISGCLGLNCSGSHKLCLEGVHRHSALLTRPSCAPPLPGDQRDTRFRHCSEAYHKLPTINMMVTHFGGQQPNYQILYSPKAAVSMPQCCQMRRSRP